MDKTASKLHCLTVLLFHCYDHQGVARISRAKFLERHCANALEVARRLESHPEVNRVIYPFLPSHPQHELAKRQMRHGGGLVTIDIKGGRERAMRFLNNIKMCTLSSNLGDTRTIITHPASTTHAKLSEEERVAVGITPGMVRISVGLEHVEDVYEDIVEALGH